MMTIKIQPSASPGKRPVVMCPLLSSRRQASSLRLLKLIVHPTQFYPPLLPTTHSTVPHPSNFPDSSTLFHPRHSNCLSYHMCTSKDISFIIIPLFFEPMKLNIFSDDVTNNSPLSDTTMDAFKGSYTRTSADNYEEMLKVCSAKILILLINKECNIIN